MFKSARWRSDKNKNKIKAVFRLQLGATQVHGPGWEPLVVTLTPHDLGKPSLRSEKSAAAAAGECRWTSPLYETVRLTQDPMTGKIIDKPYQLLVSTAGSGKCRVLGEATINLADYFEVFKPSSVSLPLQGSPAGAILHVTVQRVQGDAEGRENDENGDAKRQRRTLQSQLSFPENEIYNSGDNLTKSGSFDAISASGSESSIRSVSSAPDESVSASTNSWGEAEDSTESGTGLRKQKSDLNALARQLEVSDLELQTLRKQVVKESRRGQDLSRELGGIKEERDALRRELEELKASKKRSSDENESVPWSVLEELKKELDHEKNLNSNLRLQLDKMQESNSELMFAARDLEEMLERKNGIVDLSSELELYKKDREGLEMQMEQLALDYEILKQENHDISSRLEQVQLREQLRMQYECSAHLAVINDLEIHVESLEAELQKQQAVVHEKVEQEQRAIEAEETLRKTRRNSARIAEQLQEEVRRLSAQMSSAFDANEKLALRKTTECRELHVQKRNLEEMLERTNEELTSVKHQHHVTCQQLLSLYLELEENREDQMENQRKSEVNRLNGHVSGIHQGKQIESNMHNNSEKEGGILDSRKDDLRNAAELISEMANLREVNECMAVELKDMQERYSDMSLKFAEVEGERQRLLITIRTLKNALKN